MSAPVASLRAVAVGATGTGKSTLLRELFVARAPRVVALDVTGEWERGGAPHVARSLDGLLNALEHFASKRARRWLIAAQLGAGEVEELAPLLVPESGSAKGLAAIFGGLALAVDEVDTFAPQSAPPEIRNLWQRGRHAGLSIFAATQRPSACHRIVTSQSQFVAVCQLHEPRDVAYARSILPPDAYAAALALPRFHAVMLDTVHRRAWQLDAGRAIVARYGADASAPPPALAPLPAAR